MSNEMTDEDALERSPYLDSLKRKARLAPSRLSDLLKAAKRRKAPVEPGPGECCGSSCKPCVTDLWKQELRCWKECHPDGESDEERNSEGEADEKEPVREHSRGRPTIEIALEEGLKLDEGPGQAEEGVPGGPSGAGSG